MWDLSSLLGTEPMSPAVEAQNLNHWTAHEVPCFLLFSSLEFGAHSPVVMSGPQCPCISQPIYTKSTDVPICTDGSVSVQLIMWEHAHILMDTVVTCVLMCVDLRMRTPRQTDTGFYCASQIMLIFFFNKLNIYDNSVLNKYIGTIFPTVFANFMSLSPFGNSHNISSHFIIIMFVFLICDQCFLLLLPNKGLDDG